MPLRNDIKKILVIGSGPIIIGQAAEFDYAGTQVCRALKEDGLEVVLVNSNPATIMTDKTMADKVYIEPLTLPVLRKIIKLEKPDSILPTMGGQTALTLSMQLAKEGFLKEQDVKLLGAVPETIDKAEDRISRRDTPGLYSWGNRRRDRIYEAAADPYWRKRSASKPDQSDPGGALCIRLEGNRI